MADEHVKRSDVQDALYAAMKEQLGKQRLTDADRLAVITRIAEAYAAVANADPTTK